MKELFCKYLPLLVVVFYIELDAQSNCPLEELLVSSIADVVVGDGTPASCTQEALRVALISGGFITCDCGPEEVVISITAPLVISNHTVFDGGGLVTLDGGLQTRIIDKVADIDFTIQRTKLVNGKAPGPSGHFTNQCGGAILSRGGGILKVIQCHFENNTVTSTDGSDIAGGAVYVFVEEKGIFSSCTFLGNSASNGGAIGGLGSDIIITNSKFYRNAALGRSGGLRGHGGAINLDGVELGAADKLYSVCGSEFVQNHAEAQGGASNTVFSDNVGANLSIDQCYFEGNYLRSTGAGNGGAIFHVVDDLDGGYSELQFSVTRSTFYRNHCNRQGGGIWAIINGQGVIENCTFFRDSTANPNHGLGGGVSLLVRTENRGGWLIRNNTFANNYSGLFGGGLFSNPAAPTTWQNNILLNNRHSNTNPWVGLNVNREMDVQAGNNIQWPQYRPNGSEDTRATENSYFMESSLETILKYQGGPTPTLLLVNNAVTGTGCPVSDQRLVNRSGACSLGSYASGINAIPSSVSLQGLQLGTKYYLSTGNINSSAKILSSSIFSFENPGAVFLDQGFEVMQGATLEIK